MGSLMGSIPAPPPPVPKYPVLHGGLAFEEEAIKHVLEMELPNKVTVWKVTHRTGEWNVHAAINTIDKSVTIKLKGDKFPYDEALNKLRAFL
jgi:hypothetical protein